MGKTKIVLCLGLICSLFFSGCSGDDPVAIGTAAGVLSASLAAEQRNTPLINENGMLAVTVGMRMDSLEDVLAQGQIRRINDSIVEYRDPETQPSGKWTFCVENETLSWFAFSNYCQEISESAFERSLAMTRDIIQEYSIVFGSPGRVVRGIEEFRDPAVQRHTGYQVLNVTWNTEQGRVVVDFSFVGEGNDYAFLVSLQGS